MKRILVGLLLSITAASCAPKQSGSTATVSSDRLVSIASAEPVREVFNAASDRIRVVTLLSPT